MPGPKALKPLSEWVGTKWRWPSHSGGSPRLPWASRLAHYHRFNVPCPIVQLGDTRPELLRRAHFISTPLHMDTGLSQMARSAANRHSRGAWLRVDRAAKDVQLREQLHHSSLGKQFMHVPPCHGHGCAPPIHLGHDVPKGRWLRGLQDLVLGSSCTSRLKKSAYS